MSTRHGTKKFLRTTQTTPSPTRLGGLLLTICLFNRSFGQEPAITTIADPAISRFQQQESVSQTVSIKDLAATPKVRRYAEFLLKKYDYDGNGKLDSAEWQAMRGHPELIDANGDGFIDIEELVFWIAKYGQKKRIGVPVGLEPAVSQPQNIPSQASTRPKEFTSDGRRRDTKFYVSAKRLPVGLPDWFLVRDQDGDGQLTTSEFSPTGLPSELAEFATFDINGDGVMTAKECVGQRREKPAALLTR